MGDFEAAALIELFARGYKDYWILKIKFDSGINVFDMQFTL